MTPGAGNVAPRFPDDVATALARDPMRRMETPRLIVYYPAHRHDEAARAAARIERCANILSTRAFVHNGLADRKMVVVMPEVPFNNAFVESPSPGLEPVAVVPTLFTFDFQSQAGMPPDPSGIGCHEITHYVHGLQIRALPWLLSVVFGNLLSPQDGFDAWFWEGLATYYETALQPGTGRLGWPLWNGVFHAGVAGRQLTGGDLNEANRDFPQGGHYLVGAHFVAFLMERYGEAAVWSAIHEQGGAIVPFFGVSGRFEKTFGKPLSVLVDEFAAVVAQRYPVRIRPSGQTIVHAEAGRDARYARGAQGTEALLSSGRDRPTTLQVFDPSGRLLRRKPLTEVLPPRLLTQVAVSETSGLSVSADGKQIYFTVVDLGPTLNVAKLVRYDVAQDALSVVVQDLGGAGGGLLPDGTHYLYARAEGDARSLAVVDLVSGALRPLAALPPRTFIGTPRSSPSGDKAVAGVFIDGRPMLATYDVATGKELSRLATQGPVDDPAFVDEGHVVYLGSVEGRFQVLLADLAAGTSRPLTDVPYLASNPQVVKGSLRFLNRQGLGYTVDEVTYPSQASAASPPSASSPTPPAAQAAPATPQGLVVVSPPIPPETLEVLSDEPASSSERVLAPQGIGVSTAAVSDGPVLTELTLTGGDRLNQHRWAITGGLQSTTNQPSLTVAYANRQLAPFLITAEAAHLTWQARVADLPSSAPLAFNRQQDVLSLALSRAFWGNPVGLGAFVLRDRIDTRPEVFAPSRQTRSLAGPTVSAAFQGLESTPESGARRLAYGSLSATAFPSAWNSVGTDFADLRAAARVILPLAPFRTPTLSLTVRGRWLAGTTAPWLQLGGASSSAALFETRSQPGVLDINALFPPGVHFFEGLRGFEDVALFANHVGVADGSLRFPLIIDRGWASSLGFLPAFFVSQIDLGLFGALAGDGHPASDGGVHASSGGNVDLSFALSRVPLRLRYQIARRLTDDHAWVQLVGLDLGG